ncbi:MAG TPA: SEC-C metal-binding domain-containing protein [Negativicutes bacterium]|nr:SEC-C metal-binding domain-containing protein [Negativicutes bacterium]
MELHNNTRQWALKGYTPNELRQAERKHLRLLPSNPSSIPGVKEGKAIGRNAPCPCGSGKKYKKCCGRGGQFDDAF